MGIVGLWTVLSHMSTGLNRRDYLHSKAVAVDISGLLYSYYYTHYDERRETYHVRAAFQIIVRIISLGLIPIFVFDSGIPHELKSAELQRRRAAELRMANKFEDSIEKGVLEEYQRLEMDGYNDIARHFQGSPNQDILHATSPKRIHTCDAPSQQKGELSDIMSPPPPEFTRCDDCIDIKPVRLSESSSSVSSPSIHILSDATMCSDQKNIDLLYTLDSDLFNPPNNYDYENSRHLLSHKIIYNCEGLASQLEDYAAWQLKRCLLSANINEQIFITTRQQRDSARLSLMASQNAHRPATITTSDQISTSMHEAWPDTTGGAETYFSNLAPHNISLKDTQKDNDPDQDELSKAVIEQTQDYDSQHGSSLINTTLVSHEVRAFNLQLSTPPVGTTFSSFVGHSGLFPEVNIFRNQLRGFGGTYGKITGDGLQGTPGRPLSREVLTDVQRIAFLFNIPCLKCKPGYEAEQVCALLNTHGYVAAVLTEDSDIVAYQMVLVLRLFGGLSNITDVSGFQTIRQRDVNIYFTHDDITFLALILGCDFCDGVPGFGYVHAIELLIFLKYFVNQEETDINQAFVSIQDLIDRFRLYIQFNGIVEYPNSAASRIQAHSNFVTKNYAEKITGNWESVLAYRNQPCFNAYFPDGCTASQFIKDLARQRYLFNRRLWSRRELLMKNIMKNLSNTEADALSRDLGTSIFAKLTKNWSATIKIFKNHVKVEDICQPVCAGGRSFSSLMQSVESFDQSKIVTLLHTLTEGTDDYQPRKGEELRELIGLPASTVTARLTNTRISFIKNRDEINRVRVTELLSSAVHRGHLFDFSPLGKRAFCALKILFVLNVLCN